MDGTNFGAVRGYIPAMIYIPVTTIAVGVPATIVGGSLMLGPDSVPGCSFHNVWTDTVAGDIKIEASNDPRALHTHFDHANADWFDITSQIVPVDPAATSSSDMVQISDIRFEFIRLSLGLPTAITGSGTFKSYFAAHGT
ncbi:MAG: hypothetical protein V3U34_00465 [candidate division NC10 bacterium]